MRKYKYELKNSSCANMTHLPNPLPLVAKIGKANPPGRYPSQGLLEVGQAGDELKLLRSFGLGEEASLSKARDYFMMVASNLLLAVLESLNPRESHHVRCDEKAAQSPVVNPPNWANPLL